MKIPKIVTLLTLVVAIAFMILTVKAGTLYAQAAAQPMDIAGDWQGTLNVGLGLRVILHVTKSDSGGWNATFYVVDQSPAGIPVSSITLEGSTFKFSIDQMYAGFEGKLSSDSDSIVGNWTQNNGPSPLTLQRATEKTAWGLPDPNWGHKQIAVDPKILDGFVGRYQMDPSFIVTMTREGEHFYTQATGQNRFELFPFSENKFFAKIGRIEVTFHADDHGVATEMVITQGGRDLPPAKRVSETSAPSPLPAAADLKFHSGTCAGPNSYPDARCGTLVVYENRAAKTGRLIPLNIAVLPALNKEHEPDPLFILGGGPGQAVVEDFMPGPQTDFFKAVRAKRDIVFVDQRGTGGSHALPCSFFPSTAPLQEYFSEYLPLERARECKQELSKDADLTQYLTSIAMDDLDDVRAALGYDRINLDGGSYGTRAAFVYMRQHPTHVRAVILDAVAPPGDKQPLPRARGMQHALDRMIDDCAADKGCHEAYPNVRGDLDSVLANLGKQPAKIQVINPATRKSEPVELTRDDFVRHLDIFLYSTVMARRLPSLFNQAAHGNLVPFANQYALLVFGQESDIARGMWLSIFCTEDVQWITDADIARETAGTYLGALRVNPVRAACKEWPIGKLPPDSQKLVDSTIPVLLFSGDEDAATPSSNAAEAAKHLPNSRQIVFKYGAHGTFAPCVDRLMETFLDAASAKSLDDSCVKDVQPPDFFTPARAAAQAAARFSDIPASATPSEIWEGKLDFGAQSPRLILRLYRSADGKLTAAADLKPPSVPDNPNPVGQANLRVDVVSIEKNHLHFEMKTFNAVYDGDVAASGTDIHGTWKQGQASLTLDLHRTDAGGSGGGL